MSAKWYLDLHKGLSLKSPSTVNCPAGLQGEKRWCQLNLFSLVFYHYYSVPPTCINLVSSIFLPSSSPYCPLLSYLLTVDHLLSHPFFPLLHFLSLCISFPWLSTLSSLHLIFFSSPHILSFILLLCASPPPFCIFNVTFWSPHTPCPSTLPSLFLPAFISHLTSPLEWFPSIPYSSITILSLLILLSCFSSLPVYFFSITLQFFSLCPSSSSLSSLPFLPPVPTPCQKPQRLWVAEAVSFLLQWGLRQDDHQHHRCGLCLPEWILGMHWKAGHYTTDWQVEGHPWSHTQIHMHGLLVALTPSAVICKSYTHRYFAHF